MLSKVFLSRRLPVTLARTFYDSKIRYDTIYAPSTFIPPARGSPLGVIRVSGRLAKQVLHQLTSLRLSQDENSPYKIIKPRHATLTRIFDPNSRELIDIGLVLWFQNPHSYTGEDVCEFHMHGSHAIMTNMLSVLSNMTGLRPAEAGEFTRRAVSNGKMTLVQAESLPDLISSQTDHQRKLALKGLDGSTQTKYELWIEKLIKTLAHLEASIDFGEDELIGEREVIDDCLKQLNYLSDEIANFIRVSARCREFIKSGARVAILGKPNAGKSTFMNLICKQNKSIVSDLSGTTRDVVEHSLDLGGHAITIYDTAGLKDLPTKSSKKSSILEQHENIEREGIKRALEIAKSADLVIYLIDGSMLDGKRDSMTSICSELDSLIRVFNANIRPVHIHAIINKIDLNDNISRCNYLEHLKDTIGSKSYQRPHISYTLLSCKTLENLDSFVDQLTNSIKELASHIDTLEGPQCGDSQNDNLQYVNERHLSLLKSAQRHLKKSSELNLQTIDLMAQHARESLDYLSRIVGSVSNEQVIDVIFKDFCIGK